MVENNGISTNVLVLQGTIATHFRGNTYQLLIDMYLPSGYPNRPPVCYVRLPAGQANMYLKENHRHVGQDGKVYLPYLHEWNRSSHNLIELVVAMSSVFSADPPVFTRAATAEATASASTPLPPPPLPPPPPMPSTQQQAPRSGGWQTESEREAILAVQIAEANEAAEAARRAEQEEADRTRRRLEQERLERQALQAKQLATEKQRQYEIQRKQQIQQQVNAKCLQYIAKQKQQEYQNYLKSDARDMQRLEMVATQKLPYQEKQLRQQKQVFTKQLETVNQAIADIQVWIEKKQVEVEEKEEEERKKRERGEAMQDETSQREITMDDRVQPSNKIYEQMLELSAENATISDVLYFLDKALYRGHIDCEQHLRQVRKLAKRQFLIRAHLMKIAQHSVMMKKTTM